jgi:hypothetical protein
MHNLMSRRSTTSIFTTTPSTARMPYYQRSFDDTTLPPMTSYASTALHSTLHFTVFLSLLVRSRIPPPCHTQQHTQRQRPSIDPSRTTTSGPPLPLLQPSHQDTSLDTKSNYNMPHTHKPQVVFPPPEEYITQVEQAFQAEVTKPIQTIRTMDPMMFLPAPHNWRQILQLPPTIQTHWANALLVEIKELIRKKTFAHANPNKDDPIIPVTCK